jgi:CHASE2 domain-containing sensor protein
MSLDPRARLGRPAGRRFLFEWGALGCLGIAVILLSALGHWTAGIDHLVYDRFLALHSQPVLSDIVVVEIDNTSIERLGHWPWPRSVHASLLAQLAKAKPAAVIYESNLSAGPAEPRG